MDAYVLDWLYLLARWLHIVAAIAWIGASFYFVWLDNSLEPPKSDDLKSKGVNGELWAVHGGGFYNPQKYLSAPPQLPARLHWFYWESYTTWMSGFVLFILVYLLHAEVYLVDPRVFLMSKFVAITAALGFLAGGWIVYDSVCRLFGFRDRLVGIVVGILVSLSVLGACKIFPGRAAYLIIGAMMATIMSANVLFWIIPGQRKVTATMRAGLPVDSVYGKRGKQRSVHNTYLTLPVLVCMLSNHFPFMYQHQNKAIALVLMMFAGVLIREFFLRRHKGQLHWWLPISGMIVMACVFVLIKPEAAPAADGSLLNSQGSEQAYAIVRKHCYGCHALQPTMIGGGAPKGIAFESVQDLERYADAIYVQVVQTKAMPLGNLSQMTDGEREQLGRWIRGRGVPVPTP